jgi:hypothetical protein
MEKKWTNDSFNVSRLGGGRIKGRSVSSIWTPITCFYKPEFLRVSCLCGVVSFS